MKRFGSLTQTYFCVLQFLPVTFVAFFLHAFVCEPVTEPRQSSRLRKAKRLLLGSKFEIKHKSRCFQKSKLVNWGGQACRLGGPGSSGPPLAPALTCHYIISFYSSKCSLPILSIACSSMYMVRFFLPCSVIHCHCNKLSHAVYIAKQMRICTSYEQGAFPLDSTRSYNALFCIRFIGKYLY